MAKKKPGRPRGLNYEICTVRLRPDQIAAIKELAAAAGTNFNREMRALIDLTLPLRRNELISALEAQVVALESRLTLLEKEK